MVYSIYFYLSYFVYLFVFIHLFIYLCIFLGFFFLSRTRLNCWPRWRPRNRWSVVWGRSGNSGGRNWHSKVCWSLVSSSLAQQSIEIGGTLFYLTSSTKYFWDWWNIVSLYLLNLTSKVLLRLVEHFIQLSAVRYCWKFTIVVSKKLVHGVW